MNRLILLFLKLAHVTSASLVSDEFAMNVLLQRQREITHERRLQPGGGGSTAGSTTSTSCTSTTCSRTSTSVSGNYMSRSSLLYDTSTGKFSGSFITNGCPNHYQAYHYNGVYDSNVPTTSPSCIVQTIPATGYSTVPKAAPLRSVIGYTISGGEKLYGPMDAGFTVGQVCTNTRGVCPGGTDTMMCAAWHERVCGTTNLKGYTSGMHMLLSDCGGHAGYHNHEGLNCEYNASSRFSGHSEIVGLMLTGQALFGMYESTGTFPTDLDACSGHFGPTPATTVTNSDGTTNTYEATTNTYHYHVTPTAPFFAGCFGPIASLTAAKALYPSCSDSTTTTCSCNPYGLSGSSCTCSDGSLLSVCTALGKYTNYKINCPIFRHGTSSSMSQVVTTDSTCIPCTGNCGGVDSTGNEAVAPFAVTPTSTPSATAVASGVTVNPSATTASGVTATSTPTSTAALSPVPGGGGGGGVTPSTNTFNTGPVTTSTVTSLTQTCSLPISAGGTGNCGPTLGTLIATGSTANLCTISATTPTCPFSSPSTSLSAYATQVSQQTSKVCIQNTDPRCDYSWLFENFGRFSQTLAAYCNDKYLVLMSTGAPNHIPNLQDVLAPPKGTFTNGSECRTRTWTESFTVVKIPLNPIWLDTATRLNNVNLAAFPGGPGDNGYLDGSTVNTNYVYGLPTRGNVGFTLWGQEIYPVFNNQALYTPEMCEVDSCNEHVGQGGGSPHYHGDPYGPKCSYHDANYTSDSAHPPLIGFATDGGHVYGRHIKATNLGYSTPLDDCGGHSHDSLTYHYHPQVIDAYTDSGSAESRNTILKYTLFTPGVFRCFKGNISADANVWANKGHTSFSPCTGMTRYYEKTGITIRDRGTLVTSPATVATATATATSTATSTSTGSSGQIISLSNTPTISLSNTPTISPSNTPTISSSTSPTISSSPKASTESKDPSSSPKASTESKDPSSSPKASTESKDLSSSPKATSSTSSLLSSTSSSVSSSSPKSSPKTISDPIVQVSISFANVAISAFTTTSGRSNIAAAIAKGAGVDASKVKIDRVTNKATGAIIYSGSSTRRLQIANIEVISVIQADSTSKASEIGNSIKASATTFSAAVLTNLKASDSASFSSATAEVDVATIISPSTPSLESSKATATTLSDGPIAGIVIAGLLLLLVGAGFVYYSFFCNTTTTTSIESKSTKETSSSSSDDVVSISTLKGNTANDLVDATSSTTDFASTNPMMQNRKNKKAEFDPVSKNNTSEIAECEV
jgi:hypothetical protein